MQIVRRREFVTTPWKNGAGITHEALRMPPGGDAFLWRVSVAELGASGPFSDFSGYRRAMVLLRGGGLRLHFADRSALHLREVGDLVQFDGAVETRCELQGGACTDLNLILCGTVTGSDVRVERLVAPLSMNLLPQNVLLVFAICGAVTLDAGSSGPVELGEWDLAHMPPGVGGLIRLEACDRSLDTRVFIASFRGFDRQARGS
jgi:environmental stress-induced protein Ves